MYIHEWQIVALYNVNHYISMTFSFQQKDIRFLDIHSILQ